MRALYVGRFQPIHRGHVEAIKYILAKVDELVIVIGSAQLSHSPENPFTVGERVRLVRAALSEIGVEPRRCYIIPIPDAEMHSIWVAEVISYTPPFDVVYSNEPLTSRLFKEGGFKVETIPFFHREIFSATEVRRRMLTSEDWRELLSESVVNLIEEIGGVSRLEELTVTDSPL